MYAGATTAVKMMNGVSEEFELKVGVHHGLVLSPLYYSSVVGGIV